VTADGSTRRDRIAATCPWVSTLVRLGLAGILITAGLLKVVDPQSSVQAVRGYQLLPESLEVVVGWGLPFAEMALGLLLVAGAFTRVVAVVTGALMIVFIAAVVSAWVRGLTIDCGCFGGGGVVVASQTRYLPEIARDTGFWVMAVWLVWKPASRFSLDATDLEGTV